MSRWFRHYAGMMRDEKLVRAAVKSKQAVERVVWVWGAVLESASEINDGGRFDLDAAEAAYFLRCDESDVLDILAALAAMGRLSEGIVVKWGDRQFDSDKSRDRQKRYRDRLKSNGDGGSDVTEPSRDGGVTPQETETEPEDKTRPSLPEPGAGARDLFGEIWEAFPRNPTSNEVQAASAFAALTKSDQSKLLDAAQRYRRWFAADNEARKRTEEAGLRYVPHLSTWIETAAWLNAGDLPIKGESEGPVIAMVRLSRDRDAELWAECERIQGKRSPTSDWEWSFKKEIVDQARAALDERKKVA